MFTSRANPLAKAEAPVPSVCDPIRIAATSIVLNLIALGFVK
jgi:hypothetical protein